MSKIDDLHKLVSLETVYNKLYNYTETAIRFSCELENEDKLITLSVELLKIVKYNIEKYKKKEEAENLDKIIELKNNVNELITNSHITEIIEIEVVYFVEFLNDKSMNYCGDCKYYNKALSSSKTMSLCELTEDVVSIRDKSCDKFIK